MVVSTCHDADLCSGPERYFRGGNGSHLVSLPFEPLPPWLRLNFPFENQHGPKFVRDSSDKIYRRGHNKNKHTIYERRERELQQKQETEVVSHTDTMFYQRADILFMNAVSTLNFILQFSSRLTMLY